VTVGLLLLLLAAAGVAQTVPGTRIDNVGVLRFGYADGTPDSLSSSTVSLVVEAASYRLTLSKYASRDTVTPGQDLVFTVRVENAGPEALTNVEVLDTLDASRFEVLGASPGQVSGPVVRHAIARLAPGGVDSILIFVRVRPDVTGGSQLSNTAHAISNETGTSIVRAQAVVAIRAGSGSGPMLTITKSVSRDTVETGGLVTYTLRVRNTGDVALTNVFIVDSLALDVDPVVVSQNAGFVGRVARGIFGSVMSFGVGQEDTVLVTVRVRPDVADGSVMKNVAWAASDQTPPVSDSAAFVVRARSSTSCRVQVTATPSLVIGNGIAATVLRATVTDTLGVPKPDGTPVVFRTSVGTFSNGLDSIVVATVGGFAVDSLKALIVSNAVVYARATISVDDAGVCRDSTSVAVVFYPGALTGIVVHNSTNEPEAGAIVRVYSSAGVLIGTAITGADGSYIIPVPTTDDYTVRIQTLDEFGLPMNTVTTVSVAVPGIGGIPPVKNLIVISGKVYYLVSRQPVAAAGIKVVLTQLAGGGGRAADDSYRTGRMAIDSTFTDTTGSYTFSGLPAGNQYSVSIDDAFLRGSVSVAPLEPGTYVTDVNIPITLNPTLELSKAGPVRAYRRDTVGYAITVRNVGNLSMTSAVLTDSLDRSMRFVSSAPAPSFLDTVAGILRWNFGRFDSAASPASVRSILVQVRFVDTTTIGRMLTNTARFVSDQTIDTSVTVTTEIFEADLVVEKSTARPIVEIGDQAIYTVTVRNATPAMLVRNVVLEDRPPVGFTYLAGSSHRDTARLPDPAIVRTGSGIVLQWMLADSLLAGASRSVTYRMIVGAGAAEGDGVNRAFASASAPNGFPLRSAVSEARVEVQKGVFTDRGLVVGKVFYDPNRNSYQDPGEGGVEGVELITEDGTRIVTGADGKYSIPDIAPGEHVIRVREFTLPAGTTLHAGFNDFAGDGSSRFVSVPAGGIVRADFYLDGPPAEDSLVLSQQILRIGGLSLRRVVAPKNVVFIDDERPALMKLTGLNFEVGKAVLRPEAFPIIHQLANIMRENADEDVTIMGHTDASPISTREFPNNRVLSIARAEAVKAYLVEREGIDLLRIATIGYGETIPVAENKTREGRALNRRVEFAFGPVTETPKPRDSVAIMVTVPMSYDGSGRIDRVVWTDSLGEGLRYVAGSGRFRGQSVEPAVLGPTLTWTIDSLESPFDGALVYQMAAGRPAVRVVSLRSQTAAVRVVTADTTFAMADVLSTENQAAVALKGRAINFVMPSVLYETARAELRAGAESALEATAAMLREDPTLSMIVEGHTDSRPIRTKQFPSNLELSQARAASIVEMLASRFGIDRGRMEFVGFGEHRPIATNLTAEGRQKNRRVEMRLFRSEFWTSVLKEGGVDSTEKARINVVPTPGAAADSAVAVQVGGRYLAVMIAVWAGTGNRPAAVALVDTLPSWMTIERSTVRSDGSDSVDVSRTLRARGIIAAPAYRLMFEFRVESGDGSKAPWISKFAVIRRSSSGVESAITGRPLIVKPVR
jgi:uncharacterized repeat protein (TIGR01451 family)